MPLITFLKSLGIEAPLFIAGSSGAVAFLTSNSAMTRTQKFFTVLSGGASANYLTPLVCNWINADEKITYGVSFLVGYAGMKFVELLINETYKKITK